MVGGTRLSRNGYHPTPKLPSFVRGWFIVVWAPHFDFTLWVSMSMKVFCGLCQIPLGLCWGNTLQQAKTAFSFHSLSNSLFTTILFLVYTLSFIRRIMC
jgi:hypothetical protein